MNDLLKSSLTESKFNMWRACIAILVIDNKLDSKEKDWFEAKLKHIPFNDEQLSRLHNDLVDKVSFLEIIPAITDKRDRAFLLHQIRVLGHIDGRFDESERSAFKNLEKIIIEKLDVEGIRAEIEALEVSSYHEDEVYKVDNEHSAVEGLYKSFLKFLNPGDYKFPES
jgi:hypothetical protein